WSSGTAALLAAATDYHIYAVISDGSVNRLAAVGDGADNSVGVAEDITEVAFTHAPTGVLLAPPDDGVTVNARDAYQIRFTAQLLGDAAQMLVVLSSTDYGATSNATVLLDDDGGAESDWILNSTDGSFANRQVLTEGTDVTYNIQVKRFGSATSYLTTDNDPAGGEASAPVDGTYYLYLIIDDGDDNFTETADVAIQAPGTIKITGVADDPPIEYLSVSPTVFTTVLGDTVTLTLYGVDNSNTVDLIDAYVSVDTTFFETVNSSAPFSSVLSAGGTTAIKNTTINDNTLGTRKLLNLTLFASGAAIALANDNSAPTTLGTFRLVSRGTTAAVTQESDVSLLRDATYKTAFYNDGGEVTISYRSPVAAGMVSPRGQLVGIGNLQSRSSSAVAFTLELRQPGSYDPISDDTFESSNDDETGTDGVQVTADADGRFTLTQVPSGVYDLVIHYDRYLDVKQSVTITPATDATLVNFGILLGGDAGGFTDSTGADMPDNEVTATGDLDKIANNFGATSSSSSWDNTTKAKFADINESGEVDIADLTIASSNLTSQGAQPVFKPVEGDNTGAAVLIVGLPSGIKKGQSYDVNVVVNQFTGLRGYDLDLGYDPALFTVGQVKRGNLFNRSYSFSTTGEGEVGVVNALIGREAVSANNAALMTVRLTARRDAQGLINPVWVKGARLVDALYRPMDVAGVRMTATQVPKEFALDQNYPNPFNPETVIRIHLPEDGAVTLKIYNLLGQEIRTLLQTPMQAGIYNVTWDGMDHSGRMVSSGVYFYRVTAEKYTDTKRMVLMK
ncbi:MAG: T9SS type A sorting domain-containing protein, partial [Candidatus Latescibacteria bacterium]|nr:T9SS type A sorting domain-containing protein [Candidatus Latescibacterota bacterium]